MSQHCETMGSLSTVLAPVIGCDKAAEVAKKSLKENKTLRQVVREMSPMSDEELGGIIDFDKMTAPNVTQADSALATLCAAVGSAGQMRL